MAEYAAVWLRKLDGQLSPRSLRGYESDLRVHILPTLGTRRLDDLPRAVIRDWLERQRAAGYRVKTIRRRLGVLRSLLMHAVDRDLIPDHHAHGLARVLGRERRQVDPVCATPEEVVALVDLAMERNPVFGRALLLLARTGLRRGELLGLTAADVQGQRLRIERARYAEGIDLPKAGRTRYVDLSPDALDAVRWLAGHAKGPAFWLFSVDGRRPWHPNTLTDRFRRLVRRLPVRPDVHPHSLRHAFATLLLQAGRPVQYVQRQLGHASISLTVDLYGRHMDPSRPDFVAVLDEVCRRPPHPVPPSSRRLRLVKG